ncbi:MAG: hypothetical protein C0483_24225 [Pirellula sp.]|nr:hypothetical protein [Pirellula sp.]
MIVAENTSGAVLESTASDEEKLWKAVSEEVIYAHAYWKLYEGLFRKSKETIAVLNKVAGFGWRAIHDSLVSSIILRLTRVMDPARNGKNENLSLARLVDVAIIGKDEETVCKLKADLDRIKVELESLKFHRDKRLAHNDLECRLDKKLAPALPPELFQTALASISEVMNEIGKLLGNNYSIFDPVMEPDAVSIVMHLEDGLAMSALKQRVRMKQISAEELWQEFRKLAFEY